MVTGRLGLFSPEHRITGEAIDRSYQGVLVAEIHDETSARSRHDLTHETGVVSQQRQASGHVLG